MASAKVDHHRSAELRLMSGAATDPSVFKAAPIFELLDKAMKEDKENLAEKVKGIYCFKVKHSNGQEGIWIINAKAGKGSVTFNGTDKPDVTFSMSDEDVVGLISGKLNPQKAFFQGKVKITGNMGLAMKLTELSKKAKIDVLAAKL